MKTLKIKIITAMVGIAVFLSAFILLFTNFWLANFTEKMAMEEHVGFLSKVYSLLQLEINMVIHPMNHLKDFIEDVSPPSAPLARDVNFQNWMSELGSYAENLFPVSSSNVTLDLYFVKGDGSLDENHLSFYDSDQDGFLNYPYISRQLPTMEELKSLNSVLSTSDPTWLPVAKFSRLDPRDQVYWRYVVPIFSETGANAPQPSMLLILKGPISHFSKHFLSSSQGFEELNPMICIYETQENIIAASEFFPFKDFSAFSNTGVNEQMDPSSKFTYDLKNLQDESQIPYTVISKQLSTGWSIGYLFPTSVINPGYGYKHQITLLLTALFIFLSLLMAFRVSDYINAPIEELINRFSNTANKAFPRSPKLMIERNDELTVLFRALEQLSSAANEGQEQLLALQLSLEKQVSANNTALRHTNQLLQDTITQLDLQEKNLAEVNSRLKQNLSAIEKTQMQLMTAEKTSSMKYLVSGVAHELNTPIGNTITLATYLDVEYQSFIRSFNSHSPGDKHQLIEGVKNLRDSIGQLERNILQAKRIIKMIEAMTSSDVSSSIQTFDFRAFVEIMAKTLLADFERPLQLSVEAPEPVICATDPTKVAALLRPLIQNSLDHGFIDGAGSSIKISIQKTDNGLELVYEDDGVGVESDMLQHLFTPFFTTKFGPHKGLGLNMAYNVATVYFKGSLEALSTDQPGICFKCRLVID